MPDNTASGLGVLTIPAILVDSEKIVWTQGKEVLFRSAWLVEQHAYA